MNFLHESFQKLSSDIHTHTHIQRQTNALEIIYHVALQVVNINNNLIYFSPLSSSSVSLDSSLEFSALVTAFCATTSTS